MNRSERVVVSGADSALCAWCGTELETRADARHGTPVLCTPCVRGWGVRPERESHAMTPEAYERLPVGLIEIDRQGTIRAFNRTELRRSGLREAEVVGRNFFSEVAPCTSVRAFEDTFRRMAERGESLHEKFEFVFRFRGRTRQVRIALSYLPESGRGVILIEDWA